MLYSFHEKWNFVILVTLVYFVTTKHNVFGQLSISLNRNFALQNRNACSVLIKSRKYSYSRRYMKLQFNSITIFRVQNFENLNKYDVSLTRQRLFVTKNEKECHRGINELTIESPRANQDII